MSKKDLDRRLLDNYRRGLDRYGLEMEKCLGNWVDVATEGADLICMEAARALSAHRAGEILRSMIEDIPCDSPLERVLASAVYVVGEINADDSVIVARCQDGKHFEKAAWAPLQVSVCHQHQVGQYRVDMLVTGYELNAICEIAAVNRIAVELDGHDFHEKTKEQAQRDKSRDRAIQSAGLRVYRYTGSEVWANPFKCAEEIVKAALNMKKLPSDDVIDAD